MRIVLLSGGSGKRLWPLSTPTRSKQFIKILKDQNGKPESMAQRVWRQLVAKNFAGYSLIACSETQKDIISSQLTPEVRCIGEPEQRDTFPAIALACSYLNSVDNVDRNDVILIAPIDAYVDESFFDCFEHLVQLLSENTGEIGLIGIPPTSPSSSFGYLIPDKHNHSSDSLQIECFVEKPSSLLAESLIRQGALWNSGVFAFKLGFMLNLLQENNFPVAYDDLRHNYHSLPRTSFDYEVLERAKNIIAVKYTGSWVDLGTWKNITTRLDPVTGKGLLSADSSNSHLINELDIPIVAMGVSNLVIAASPEGILVAEKEASSGLKEYTQYFQWRPRFEERRWGWYQVLDHSRSLDDYEILTKKLHILQGKNLSYQVHDMREEVWTITSGNGLFAWNDKIYPVKSGDVLHIPGGTKHALKAVSDLELIEVQSGINLVEEDITRLHLTWEEIVNHCIVKDFRPGSTR